MPRPLPDGGGAMNCGSLVARLPRGAGGSASIPSDWDPKGPSQSSTRPILPFFFDRFGRADQRLALRRRDILIRSPELAARYAFIGMHVIKTLHDGTLSASDGRCSALACGGDCGAPGTPLALALRTRANTSALGPNAIALPS